ncbi:MAG TPA: hypothetical protein PL017_09140 [Tenuifilaceae bacterium]|nr:hypothetical protein [Tenuifilaceae bacterium]HPE18461.1 hypothetical protein [Tenuifilaceae bacterium]HPJ46250.1 hypothetical protein [Tenuifilaceae bacterium]HPQ34327.1 hypothetical protein [Tenuifilaceae bacterium]HRX69390.1 hypothetical protein [Tenuifilaceae bacterium]
MKRVLLLLVFLPVFSGFAQIKVVEKSSKRQPSWVNAIEKDYIIVVGTGETVQDAQQNALTAVKERIVSSVAENVKTRSEMKVEESSVNNVSQFLEKFASQTTTESGKVPFLQGISLSKVEEFYWEKTENKDTRAIRYNYHIKYPFPEFELKKLVSDFKMRDRELTEQLDNLLAMVDKVSSTDEIEKNIGELKILSDYFMDGRKDKCSLGITRYRSLLNSIELVELESGLGELKYGLRLSNRFITTSDKPKVRSECARITSTINNSDHTIIKYDYDNCYEDPENNILVTYRFGSTTVEKPFYFDITADKAAIFVSEPFHFTSVAVTEGTVNSAIVDLTIVSKYAAPFTIDKVIIEFKGQAPVIIDGVGQSFSGKGNHSLKLNVNQPLEVESTSSAGKNVSMISGYIHFTSNNTGEKKTYRIYNHNYTTNW